MSPRRRRENHLGFSFSVPGSGLFFLSVALRPLCCLVLYTSPCLVVRQTFADLKESLRRFTVKPPVSLVTTTFYTIFCGDACLAFQIENQTTRRTESSSQPRKKPTTRVTRNQTSVISRFSGDFRRHACYSIWPRNRTFFLQLTNFPFTSISQQDNITARLTIIFQNSTKILLQFSFKNQKSCSNF